jgi:hypothetical protein
MRCASRRPIRSQRSRLRRGRLLLRNGGGLRLARRGGFRRRQSLYRYGRLFPVRRGAWSVLWGLLWGTLRTRLSVAAWGAMAENAPQFDGDIFVDRAGVGLFFSYAQPREPVNNLVRLDLQLPSQLIDSDLIHIQNTVQRRRTSLVFRTVGFRLVVRNRPRVFYGIRLANHLNVLRLY